MNPKTQAIINAAKERTRKLLESQTHAQNTAALPSSNTIATIQQHNIVGDKQEIPSSIITLGNGQSFDPFEIPNVGRANKEQSLAIELFGIKGESGCLIGPAGTGKTTTMKAIINAMILSGKIPILGENLVHKYLQARTPGIYGGSFTRIATRNLRNNCPKDIQPNIHTIHRLLEFEPEMFEVNDEKTGRLKTVRLFKPTRHKFRSLPSELLVFLLDESSMIGTRLHSDFIDAIHPSIKPQIIYIGDIAQIPPVMDDAILGYKMLEFIPQHKLVELIQVYRHAGAIVHLANKIRVGQTIPNSKDICIVEGKKDFGDERYMLPYHSNPRKLPFKYTQAHFNNDEWKQESDTQFAKEQDGSKVTIRFWKNRLDGEVGQLKALQNLGLAFFPKEIDEGRYDPLKDMILIPYNKSVGTLELNKYISGYLGKKREAIVHEVISGFQKHYMAVGDKVFFEREEAIITAIKRNGLYAGKEPQSPSITLDRWGHNTAGQSKQIAGEPIDDIEMLLNIDVGSSEEERKNQASHVIHIRKIVDHMEGEIQDPEDDDTIQTAAEINGLIGGYALTIHKSQGSQWPKVYCVFHNSHNRNLQRELLYTAITRAQKELYIIAEPETFIQGVLSQHITGNTLEEKAEFFKGKVEANKKRNDLFNGTGE